MRALAAWQICLVLAGLSCAQGVSLQPTDATAAKVQLDKADLHKDKILAGDTEDVTPTTHEGIESSSFLETGMDIRFAPHTGDEPEDKSVLPSFPAPPPSADGPLVFPRFKSGQSTESMQTVMETSMANMDAGMDTSMNMEVDSTAGVGAGVGASAGTENAEEEGTGEGAKLVNALRQLNLDINAASQQVILEEKWIKEVAQVMQSYMTKVNNVKASIAESKEKIKTKLVAKRKVENIMLQKQLESRLEEANSDLSTLSSAMQQVAKKETSFASNKAAVESFIKRATTQLDKLKGQNATSTAAAGAGGAAGAAPAPGATA